MAARTTKRSTATGAGRAVLIDSNLIIYAFRPEYPAVQQFLEDRDVFVSAISCVEVLGFHRLSDRDRIEFEAFFRTAEILPIEMDIIDGAISLRQQRRMSLGDAIVAATAIARDMTLATRNMKDFRWIEGLPLYDPLDE